MKSITCKQMGGICDVSFKEDSAREAMEQGLAHFKNSFDAEHRALYEKVTNLPADERRKWNEQFQKAWNGAGEE